jgi:hypothetical protein
MSVAMMVAALAAPGESAGDLSVQYFEVMNQTNKSQHGLTLKYPVPIYVYRPDTIGKPHDTVTPTASMWSTKIDLRKPTATPIGTGKPARVKLRIQNTNLVAVKFFWHHSADGLTEVPFQDVHAITLEEYNSPLPTTTETAPEAAAAEKS